MRKYPSRLSFNSLIVLPARTCQTKDLLLFVVTTAVVLNITNCFDFQALVLECVCIGKCLYSHHLDTGGNWNEKPNNYIIGDSVASHMIRTYFDAAIRLEKLF